jgi:hypothetical protein
MTPIADFLRVLEHVLGGVLAVAGYEREALPAHEARGLFRFRKPIPDGGGYYFLEFQTLYHAQSELSRFRVSLLRNVGLDARAKTPHALERTLSDVIWTEYGARLLPSAEHWWLYKYPADLAPQLLEAGQLLFAYGVPWLEGTREA